MSCTGPEALSHFAPLILTLQMDASSWAYFELLRQRHFPPDRNLIPAHLTLFHKLPGEHIESIVATLGDLACSQGRIPLEAVSLRFLGRGVAFAISSPNLVVLRQYLAERWNQWLDGQDRQPFQPHVTIQNKVAAGEARALHDRLSREFEDFLFEGSGFLLWRYLSGPWEQVAAFPFTAVPVIYSDAPSA